MIPHPRRTTALLGLSLALAAAPVAAQAPAQAPAATRTPQQIQLNDLRTLKDKFVGLAEAFPEGTYDWRPMEGVRSVKEVLILLVNEGNNFPTQWGAPAPAGVLPDRAAEGQRLAALDKAALAAELGKSFDRLIGFVEGLDAAGRAKEIRFFGQPVTVDGAILMATGDMHEHLGQLIAYARSNRVVPPWSR